jgi:hypothetical protein
MSTDQARSAGLQQVLVPVATLDSLFEHSNLPAPDMIKIDAEGFDLPVLQGAAEVLQRCEVVLIEAAILNRTFENDLGTVINRLAELGFRPVDVTDINRTQRHGSLWLIEMAFARRGGIVESTVTSYT